MKTRFLRLRQRQEIVATLREYLYAEGFLEVETPLLVKGTCPDLYIESVRAANGYLVTSTEYQIKRLIAEGFELVFTLTKNFRANEEGRYHSSEFTMLEWARAHETLRTVEEDAVRFIRKAFCRLYPGQERLHFNGYDIDIMTSSWERLTVEEAFETYLGLKNLTDFSHESLCQAADEAGVDLPESFRDDTFLAMSYLLDLLQPHLGRKTPTFLQEWPAYLTSSAPVSRENKQVTQRTELYIGGVEIANGFPFLTDAELQKELFANAQACRKEQVILDDKYIEALRTLPPGAGMALGVDRLVMVLTGARTLRDVQAFSWDEL